MNTIGGNKKSGGTTILHDNNTVKGVDTNKKSLEDLERPPLQPMDSLSISYSLQLKEIDMHSSSFRNN
jgi:hypothetical protein